MPNAGILPPLFLSLSCHFVNIFPTTMQSSCHPSPNLFLSLSCLCPNILQTFSTKQSKTTKQPLVLCTPSKVQNTQNTLKNTAHNFTTQSKMLESTRSGLSLPDCRPNPQQQLPCIGSNSTTSYKFIAQAPDRMQCPKSCFQPVALAFNLQQQRRC